MPLSAHDLDIIEEVRRVLGWVTLSVCVFLLAAILLLRKYKFPSSRLVLYLTLAAALQSISYVLPTNDSTCYFQAVWISFCDWAMALWICVIAFNLYQNVVKGNQNTSHWDGRYNVFVWTVSAVAAALPLYGGADVYGPAGSWCWIRPQYAGWRLGDWYAPLLLFFIYVTVTYVWCIRVLFRNRPSLLMRSRETDAETFERWNTSLKLTRYPLVFILFWIFPIINRIYDFATDDESFFLSFMHAICISTVGTVNSVIYLSEEHVIQSCTPAGLKAAIFRRKRTGLSRYELVSVPEFTGVEALTAPVDPV